jgi:ABC-type multidrug transport system ATPase subunit
MPPPAIRVAALRKCYPGSAAPALDGFDLDLFGRLCHLDPATARRRAEVWTAVRALVTGATTVLLTTQYLDEADQPAGRISVLGGAGRVVAEGSPYELRRVSAPVADPMAATREHAAAAAELDRATDLVGPTDEKPGAAASKVQDDRPEKESR